MSTLEETWIKEGMKKGHRQGGREGSSEESSRDAEGHSGADGALIASSVGPVEELERTC
jgi:hypothetical protein